KIEEPYVVSSPAVSSRSLIATGVPDAGDSGRASHTASTRAIVLAALLGGLRLQRLRLDELLDGRLGRQQHLAGDGFAGDAAGVGDGGQRQDVAARGRRAAEALEHERLQREADVVHARPEILRPERGACERGAELALAARLDDEPDDGRGGADAQELRPECL